MNDKSDKSVLKIVLGEEFKIKVEKPDEFESSFFNEVYRRASRCTEDIIANTQEYYKNRHDEYKQQSHNNYNNIIAFAGERGTGKSSAMVSFAKALKNKKIHNVNGTDYFADSEINSHKFHKLKVIDPSLFEDEESIFEIIIARMFAAFKGEVLKSDKEVDYEKKRSLTSSFQKVYTNLKTLSQDKKGRYGNANSGDSMLEHLSRLACGTNIRESFMELVDKYLEFMTGGEKGQSFLIIPIDDLDMNIKHACEMLEQIRKYLQIPNVIILMAIKTEQLLDVIEQDNRDKFKGMHFSELSDDPKHLATRYFDKLIPEERRLNLPSVLRDFGTKVEIVDKSGVIDKSELKFNSIQDTVLGTIYKETGLIFMKPKHGFHVLVPDNLRELVGMVSSLKKFGIENCNSSKLNRLERFEEYFINDWTKNNLNKDQAEFLFGFKSVHPELLNNTVLDTDFFSDLMRVHNIDSLINPLGNFYRYQTSTPKEVDDITKEVEDIFSGIGNPYNMSLGDVLFVLNSLSNKFNYKFNRSNEVKFIGSVRVMYTILLHRLMSVNKGVEVLNGHLINEKCENVLRMREGISRRDYFKLNFTQLSFYHDLGAANNNANVNFEWLVNFMYFDYKKGRGDQATLYEVGITAGSTNYGSFSLVAPFFYILFPEKSYGRIPVSWRPIKEESFVSEVQQWLSKYSNKLLYFIDVLDYLFDNIKEEISNNNDIKGKSVEYFTYVKVFYKTLDKRLKKLCNSLSYFPIEFNDFISSCPVFKCFFEDNPLDDKVEIIKEIGRIQFGESDKNEEVDGSDTKKIEQGINIYKTASVLPDEGFFQVIFSERRAIIFKNTVNDVVKDDQFKNFPGKVSKLTKEQNLLVVKALHRNLESAEIQKTTLLEVLRIFAKYCNYIKLLAVEAKVKELGGKCAKLRVGRGNAINPIVIQKLNTIKTDFENVLKSIISE